MQQEHLRSAVIKSPRPSVLIVGGAGYIGSHMIQRLAAVECDVTTLDNLSTGHRDAVLHGDFIQGDIADRSLLDQLFSERRFDAVLHFASSIEVGESMLDPARHYQNNVANTLTLLEAMRTAAVHRLVFSSTAATFGLPQYSPIDEAHPQHPINTYGRTKLMVEHILADYDRAYGLKSVVLRYFNAAGADPGGALGERHTPETHLIPLVLQAASGRRQNITIFGRDYDTPDGTCIRDYIHVADLCEAHWLALQSLMAGAGSQAYNLGNGNGFSVQDVINASRVVTGRMISVIEAARRPGDPDRLISDSRRAHQMLGWTPAHKNLETIIEDAWQWELKSRKGV